MTFHIIPYLSADVPSRHRGRGGNSDHARVSSATPGFSGDHDPKKVELPAPPHRRGKMPHLLVLDAPVCFSLVIGLPKERRDAPSRSVGCGTHPTSCRTTSLYLHVLMFREFSLDTKYYISGEPLLQHRSRTLCNGLGGFAALSSPRNV